MDDKIREFFTDLDKLIKDCEIPGLCEDFTIYEKADILNIKLNDILAGGLEYIEVHEFLILDRDALCDILEELKAIHGDMTLGEYIARAEKCMLSSAYGKMVSKGE